MGLPISMPAVWAKGACQVWDRSVGSLRHCCCWDPCWPDPIPVQITASVASLHSSAAVVCPSAYQRGSWNGGPCSILMDLRLHQHTTQIRLKLWIQRGKRATSVFHVIAPCPKSWIVLRNVCYTLPVAILVLHFGPLWWCWACLSPPSLGYASETFKRV